MTVTYLWRLAGSPSASASAFRDVKGITPTIFGPYNTCTRAHIVTFLHRYSASILAEAPAEM